MLNYRRDPELWIENPFFEFELLAPNNLDEQRHRMHNGAVMDLSHAEIGSAYLLLIKAKEHWMAI